jgi:hypothetical protein
MSLLASEHQWPRPSRQRDRERNLIDHSTNHLNQPTHNISVDNLNDLAPHNDNPEDDDLNLPYDHLIIYHVNLVEYR